MLNHSPTASADIGAHQHAVINQVNIIQNNNKHNGDDISTINKFIVDCTCILEKRLRDFRVLHYTYHAMRQKADVNEKLDNFKTLVKQYSKRFTKTSSSINIRIINFLDSLNLDTQFDPTQDNVVQKLYKLRSFIKSLADQLSQLIQESNRLKSIK